MVTHKEKCADLVPVIKELKNNLDFVVDQNKNLEDWLYRDLDDKKARESVHLNFPSDSCFSWQFSTLRSSLQPQ